MKSLQEWPPPLGLFLVLVPFRCMSVNILKFGTAWTLMNCLLRIIFDLFQYQACILFVSLGFIVDSYTCWGHSNSPHVMTKDVFPLLMFCRIVIRFAMTLLKFVKHFLHFCVFKVFMHEFPHWIKVVPRLHLIQFL